MRLALEHARFATATICRLRTRIAVPQELFLPRADQKCIFCRNKPVEPAWCLLCGAVMCCQDRRCRHVGTAVPGTHQRAILNRPMKPIASIMRAHVTPRRVDCRGCCAVSHDPWSPLWHVSESWSNDKGAGLVLGRLTSTPSIKATLSLIAQALQRVWLIPTSLHDP